MMVTTDAGPMSPIPALPACAITGAKPVTARMADLPKPVRDALLASVGQPIAEVGAPFNASDIVPPNAPPRVRFLRAYRVRDLWLVWVERGGIGHDFRLLAFRDAAKGASVAVPVPRDASRNLCTASRAMADTTFSLSSPVRGGGRPKA